ncbi:beta-lactamase/transpeptidase-like protein [Ramicandelaber brevisporus]|nr:beta-lactamase/transpeptidase-like protein [Ramicandelaber brevisporus]
MRLFDTGFVVAVALLCSISASLALGSQGNRRVSTSSASTDIQAKLNAFEAKYDSLLRQRGIPGMYFGLTTADSVICTGGIGVLNISKPDTKVDGDTLFAAGSTTKSMTAALLGTLVADGSVKSVSDPIRQYNPWFALKDPYASEHCTFEDAMSHRTGLVRYSMVEHVDRYGNPNDLIGRLKSLDPAHEFRAKWYYTDIMLDTVGHTAAHIISSSSSKKHVTYDGAMQQRVFKPMGMNRSTTLTSVAIKNGNLAAPHVRDSSSTPVVVDHDDIGVAGPSGSAYTSANDATRYLQTLLRRGVSPSDDRVLPSEFVDELIKPRMLVEATIGGQKADTDHEFGISTYGLGWFVETFRGRRLVTHSGGVIGFSTYFAWLPDHGVAAVASVNIESEPLCQAAVFDLLDIYFGEDNRGKDWATLFERHGNPSQRPDPVPDTQPVHKNLGDYGGTYTHPAFGDIHITYDERINKLYMVGIGGNVHCELKHRHYDIFTCMFPTAFSGSYDALVTFHTDTLSGDVNKISVEMDDEEIGVDFSRSISKNTAKKRLIFAN